MNKHAASYPHQSAGQLATTRVPIVGETATVADVEALLLEHAENFDTINYIYLVDAAQRLVGVMSVREVFSSDKATHVSDLAQPPLTVDATDDQEHVAHLAIKHNIKAVPVVTHSGELVGVVSSDAILRVLHEEHAEDLYRLAGVRRAVDSTAPRRLWGDLRARLPWLFLGVGGGIAAALVVDGFATVIENELVLVAFIPAIVYIADAVGAQTQLLFIERLAKDGRHFSVLRYLFREALLSTMIGSILAATIFVATWAWLGTNRLSSLIALAVLLTVLFSTVVGVLMPWLFARGGADPAVASGPLATVVRDISSLGIYLLVATWFL